MFYKILVLDHGPGQTPTVLAFLFPHQGVVHGRDRPHSFAPFLVSVDLIEAMTGLDFFHHLDDEDAMETLDTWVNWEALQRRDPAPLGAR